MGLLLDTHVLIWFVEGVIKLSFDLRQEIENPDVERFVSIVSLWEIVIKSSSKKLELNSSFKSLIQLLIDNNIQILTVNVSHLNALLTLERLHGDPFDRLIISQAISENLTIISADRVFKDYPVRIKW